MWVPGSDVVFQGQTCVLPQQASAHTFHEASHKSGHWKDQDVPHVPMDIPESGRILCRFHVPVAGYGPEVDLKFLCSAGFRESHRFEFLNFVIHVPINHLSLPPIESQMYSIRVI